MYQPDLFSRMEIIEELDLPGLLDRLADVSARPRYAFMVLNLIARASGQNDCIGPYVRERGASIPVRDWLSDAMVPLGRRDFRRKIIIQQVRADLMARCVLPDNPEEAEAMIALEVRDRVRQSGRTNVSRAVSDLVRAGFLRRHYQGYRVDHENRGAGREAVYTLMPAVKRALGKAS
jgi:hypothetical protein